MVSSTGGATAISEADTKKKKKSLKPLKGKLPDGRVVQVSDYRLEVFQKGRHKGWVFPLRLARVELDRIVIENGTIALVRPDNVHYLTFDFEGNTC